MSNDTKTPAWKTLTEDQWRKRLTETQFNVLRLKQTDPRTKGKPDFSRVFPKGTYSCVGCHADLFDGKARFECGCGWPAFDAMLPGQLTERPDGDRTEVVCTTCDGHLGHVFRGEELTDTNTRYCINTSVLEFRPTP